MKVRKFKKRQRRTQGRAAGSLICQMTFPTTDEQFGLRPLTDNPQNAIDNARKFVLHHLRKNAAVLEGASFTLLAEVRASQGGLRRKLLAKWTHGDDVEQVFKVATTQWRLLDFEEDWSAYETEI